jgi:hypothetical protein
MTTSNLFRFQILDTPATRQGLYCPRGFSFSLPSALDFFPTHEQALWCHVFFEWWHLWNGSDGLQNIGLVLSFAICLNMRLYGG